MYHEYPCINQHCVHVTVENPYIDPYHLVLAEHIELDQVCASVAPRPLNNLAWQLLRIHNVILSLPEHWQLQSNLRTLSLKTKVLCIEISQSWPLHFNYIFS